ncbi:MAG TPA: glycosyltransferase family 2 protein [Flavobacteriales bacterium]|nr:glycosyltransferase family 2 protein [Flavobacteriales bacterium]HMR27758.1 glycosyltransferase family 2 protein [Flavobacteriales bacterium]
MTAPLISIVTPSFRQAAYIEECLRSVGDQPVPVQHVVVDGGSADGSKELIAKHAGRLHWWCSEPDRGQSDAINKGLARCTGTVFNWLNSDDLLLPGALKHVADAFADDPDLLVFGGRLVHRSAGGDRPFERRNDAGDVQRLFRDPVINQPATFYRMDVVKALGGVDPALHYVMDVELWWQVLFRHGPAHLRFEDVELAVFRLHEESKTVTAHRGFLDELASLLHGLCMASGQSDLARVLAIGHDLRDGLRGIPVGTEHRSVVRGMVLHFLLKWHGVVHRREQYRMMKALKRVVTLRDMKDMDDMLLHRWTQLDTQLRSPTWWTFRLRRKWRHLRP